MLEDTLTIPMDYYDFSMGHRAQIKLIQAAQNVILNEKTKLIYIDKQQCPDCNNKWIKFGNQSSTFHDVFTDHHVKIQRLKCKACGYESKLTVRTYLGTTLSSDLKKYNQAWVPISPIEKVSKR